MNTPAVASAAEGRREQMILRHLPLVHHIARKFARRLYYVELAELDDLVSAGTIGLIQAVDKFDEDRGLAFSTYAGPRIRGAIRDQLRLLDGATRGTRSKSRQLQDAGEQLHHRLGREPTAGEVAAELGLATEEVHRWRWEVVMSECVSFDGLGVLQLTAPGAAASITARVRLAIERLPERERRVLQLYELEGFKLSEIAEMMGRTESRISQIRTGALRALAAALGPTLADAAA